MRASVSRPLVICLACFWPTCHCEALTINLTFPASTSPPVTSGGGNLEDACLAAADFWMAVVEDVHTLELTCKWGPLCGTNAEHVLTAQGGHPHRETKGTITFDNDGSTVFFVDATPTVAGPEFLLPFDIKRDLGAGVIVIGKYYEHATGDAAGHLDLLTVAIHEIGHALGFTPSLTTYAAIVGGDLDIDVTAPRPRHGSQLKLDWDGHLDPIEFEEAVMTAAPYGRRRLISTADVLAVAELSQFEELALPP